MMLHGKNILLRLVEENDLSLLVEWRNDPDIWSNFFNKFPLSMGQQHQWYSQLLANQSQKLFVICTKEGEAIGTVGIDHIDSCNQRAEFGNLLIGKKEYLGKGFAKEATELLIDFCFNHLNLNRLYLYMYEDNARAIKLYERCGFKSEGILREAYFSSGKFRNVILMSLLRREYREV